MVMSAESHETTTEANTHVQSNPNLQQPNHPNFQALARDTNDMARSALLRGYQTSSFDKTAKGRSQFTVSQGTHLLTSTAPFKLDPSMNQFDRFETTVKTKQIFFRTRNARELRGEHSSPTDQPKMKFEFRKKKKRGTSISKKSKNNLMVQKQSPSQANTFAERLSKASKNHMKSNPQFTGGNQRLGKNAKKAYSQARLSDSLVTSPQFGTQVMARSRILEAENALTNEVMDPRDLRSKIGGSLTTAQVNSLAQDPMEFQNIKIIQNLSPGQTEMPSTAHGPLGSNLRQLGRDLLLISEGTQIQGPQIDYGQHMRRGVALAKSSALHRPIMIQQKYSRSRLGANTLKSMIDQYQNAHNKSQDNMRDCARGLAQRAALKQGKAETKVLANQQKTVDQKAAREWETEIFKVNRSVHFADKLFQSPSHPAKRYDPEQTMARDQHDRVGGIRSQQATLQPQPSGGLGQKAYHPHPDQSVLQQQQFISNLSNSIATTGNSRMNIGPEEGAMDNYTYNLQIKDQRRSTLETHARNQNQYMTVGSSRASRGGVSWRLRKSRAPAPQQSYKSHQNIMLNNSQYDKKAGTIQSLSPGSKDSVRRDREPLQNPKPSNRAQMSEPRDNSLKRHDEQAESSSIHVNKGAEDVVSKKNAAQEKPQQSQSSNKNAPSLSKMRIKGKTNKPDEGRTAVGSTQPAKQRAAGQQKLFGKTNPAHQWIKPALVLDETAELKFDEAIDKSMRAQPVGHAEFFQAARPNKRDPEGETSHSLPKKAPKRAPLNHNTAKSSMNLQKQFFNTADIGNLGALKARNDPDQVRGHLSAEKIARVPLKAEQAGNPQATRPDEQDPYMVSQTSHQGISKRGIVLKEKFNRLRNKSQLISSKRKTTSASPETKHHTERESYLDGLGDGERARDRQDSQQALSRVVSNENAENAMLYDFIAQMDPCAFIPGKRGARIHQVLHQGGAVEEADIKQLQRDLISTNQLCQRLVTTQENQEPLLRLDEPSPTQVFGNLLPTVVRCRLDDMIPPVKIAIDYSLEGDMTGIDLAILYSFTNKQPDRTNCIQKFVNKPRTIVIAAKDADGRKLKQYEHPMVYVAFFSEVGCSLELTVKGTSKQMQKKMKQQHQPVPGGAPTPEPSEPQNTSLSFNQINNIIPKDDPYYIEMQEQQKELESKIKLQKASRSQVGRHIFNHPFLKEYHKEQAARNRHRLMESNYTQNVYFLQKWGIYKQVKAICIRKKNFAQKKKDAAKLFILLIKLREYMAYSAWIFKKHLKYVTWKERSTFISLCLWQAARRRFRPQGASFEIRQTRAIQRCFKFLALTCGPALHQETARTILAGFLRYQDRSLSFAAKVDLSFTRLLFIQRKFRSMSAIMAQRRQSLRGPILERQAFLVNQQLLKQDKEELYKAIQALSDKKKDFVCDCIIMLAKFDFKQEFMSWFIDNRVDSSTEQGQAKIEYLQRNVRAARAMSAILVDWASQSRAFGRIHLCTSRRQKNRIAVDDQHYLQLDEANAELKQQDEGLEQNFEEQLKQREKQKQTEKKRELTAKELVDKQKREQEEEELKKKYEKLPRELARQKALQQKVVDARKEQEEKVRLAEVMRAFAKKAPMPKFAIYSRLDKDILKALLVKCTELEDYELDDLRDLYFSQSRAEAEGALDLLEEAEDQPHHHHHDHESDAELSARPQEVKKEPVKAAPAKKKAGNPKSKAKPAPKK